MDKEIMDKYLKPANGRNNNSTNLWNIKIKKKDVSSFLISHNGHILKIKLVIICVMDFWWAVATYVDTRLRH